MPNRPLGSFSDELDTGIEKPVQATSNAVKQATTSATSFAKQQAQATTKSIVDMLYGTSSSVGEGQSPDSQDTQATPQSPQKTPQPQTGKTESADNKVSSDQEKIADLQKQLQQMHSQTYADQFKLDNEMAKLRAQRAEKEQQRLQEEEEKKQQEAQENPLPDLEAPQGKKTGMQALRSKKASSPPMRRTPVAVERARNRAEQNRGTSG